MIAFIIKSTISFLILYILYKIFLAKENMPVFKRYFLLFGILFAVTVTWINIKTHINIPDTVGHIIPPLQTMKITPFDMEKPLTEIKDLSYLKWTLYSIYFLVCFVLLLRYTLNIIRLIKKKGNNLNYRYKGYTITVLNEETPPFSFLKTLYINNKDYNEGDIQKEILIHELAHIKQLHSIDILLIELIQVICWFNPFLWLYKKEIRLNHEYLADRHVVNSGIETTDYQKFILDFTFRNNSSYLASNFNYSFIKNRFIMLTKERSLIRTAVRVVMVLPFIALLAILMSVNQTANAIEKSLLQTEWWHSILEKHDLVQGQVYNNFGNIVEFADKNSIENRVSSSTHAIMLIQGNDNDYLIIEAAEMKHDLESGMLELKSAKFRSYKADTEISQPLSIMEGDRVTINTKSIIASNLFHK